MTHEVEAQIAMLCMTMGCNGRIEDDSFDFCPKCIEAMRQKVREEVAKL